MVAALAIWAFFTTGMTLTTLDYADCIDFGLNGKPHPSCTVEQVDLMTKKLRIQEAKQGYKTLFIKD